MFANWFATPRFCSWGTGGRQARQFDRLHYVAFDSAGNLYTGEVQTGHRVQKFIRLNGEQ